MKCQKQAAYLQRLFNPLPCFLHTADTIHRCNTDLTLTPSGAPLNRSMLWALITSHRLLHFYITACKAAL